jgi:hypothetical protein
MAAVVWYNSYLRQNDLEDDERNDLLRSHLIHNHFIRHHWRRGARELQEDLCGIF